MDIELTHDTPMEMQNGQQSKVNGEKFNQSQDKANSNGTVSRNKSTIDRGCSWSYRETKILLALWGQIMEQRQLINAKRTCLVWKKIAERICESGYCRTTDQVRTRILNLITEYKRILKNPSLENRKKFIFFEVLHNIYQAKGCTSIEIGLPDYCEQYIEPLEFAEPELSGDDDNEYDPYLCPLSPNTTSAFEAIIQQEHLNNDWSSSLVDDDKEEVVHKRPRHEVDSNALTTADSCNDSLPSVGLSNEQSVGFFMERIFSQLTKETEMIREWVELERERFAQEVARHKEEKIREEMREKAFLDALSKMHEQMLQYLNKQQQPNTTCSQCSANSATSSETSNSTSNISLENGNELKNKTTKP